MKKKLGFVLFCALAVCSLIYHSRQTSDVVGSQMAHASNAVSSTMQQVGHPTFVSPHASPIRLIDDLVFVVNTPSYTVDVLDAGTREIKKRIDVGIDPVSLAVRPDGKTPKP